MNISHRINPFPTKDLYPTRLKDDERIVPRKDPVLWRDWSAGAPISKAQAQIYDTKGYLVCKGLFSQAEIDRLIAVSAELRANGRLGLSVRMWHLCVVFQNKTPACRMCSKPFSG